MRMKRTQLGTAAAAIAASTALGMALAQSAVAVAPDPPPNSGSGAFTLANNSPGLGIPDNSPGGISRSITVAGQAGTVRDVDVVTNIVHQFNGEIEIDLTHAPPAGPPKTVRFVTAKLTNREGGFGFNGTRWDDSAGQIVSDAIENNASGPQLNLVPEGAMASLIGRDPNGTWTLKVADVRALDTGTLDGWTLDVRTAVPPNAPVTTQSFLGGGGGAIPDGGGALSTTLAVSGANGYLTDVNLGTNIVHDFPPDLDVVLTSPSGTRVFISNERPTPTVPPAPPNSSRSALTTIWDDSAPVDVVRATFPLAGSQIPSMVPEGALGAFIGENPNGVWTLTAADGDPTDVGTVNSWNLTISSAPGLPPRPAPPPPPAPVCTKVNLATSILGAKRSVRGRTAAIKVRVRNRSRVAAANGAKAVFKLPNGFALAGKKRGIALRRGRVTITVGTIAAGKAKTITVRLRAKAKAKLGVKQSRVTVTALCGSKGTRARIKVTLAGARR